MTLKAHEMGRLLLPFLMLLIVVIVSGSSAATITWATISD